MTSLLRSALMCVLLAATARAAPVRVKELVDVAGQRDNALVGYGLVVGLQGQGDSARVGFTAQSVSGMLGRLGVRIDPRDIQARNIAAVLVTAELPTYLRAGSRLDVTVSSLGDARSLEGGTLVLTPLLAVDGKVYAMAQGPVQVGGFVIESAASRRQKNPPTAGRVPQGAVVETAVVPAPQKELLLALKVPDATNARRLADAINAALGTAGAPATRAVAKDAAAVVVDAAGDPLGTLAAIESIVVDVDQRARVVVSERTGTVVIGENVRLRPTAIAHGAFKISVNNNPFISQPNPFTRGRTLTGNVADIDVREGKGTLNVVPAGASVQELAAALNALGVPVRDLIAILQALRAAGALDAEIEVL